MWLLVAERTKLTSFTGAVYCGLHAVRYPERYRQLRSIFLSKALTKAGIHSLNGLFRNRRSQLWLQVDLAVGALPRFAAKKEKIWGLHRLKKKKKICPWVVTASPDSQDQSYSPGQLGSLTTRPHSPCLKCAQQTSSSRTEEADFPKTEFSLWTIQQKFSFQLWVGIHVANVGVN